MNTFTIVRRCCVLLLLLLGSGVVYADSWPSPFHDPANTCVSSQRLRLPLRLVWRGEGNGVVSQPPVASATTVYLPGERGLRAVNLMNGRMRWRVAGAFTFAYLHGDTLYAIKKEPDKDQSRVLAFNAASGAVRWDKVYVEKQHYRFDFGPVFGVGARLFVQGDKLIELNPADGTELRTYDFNGVAWGSAPAVQGNYLYGGTSHWIYTLFFDSGATRTWGTWDGGNSYPLVWRDYLCIQGPITRTQIYHLADGKPTLRYRFYGFKGLGHGIAPVGTGLYLSRSENPAGYLAARALQSGKIIWQAPMEVKGLCSATSDYVFVTGWNYVRDRHGHRTDRPISSLFVLRARDGKIMAKYQTPWLVAGFPPVISNGRILLITNGGVCCFAGR